MSAMTQTITLESGVSNLGKSPIKVRLVEGAGWITHNDEDILLEAGDHVELIASKHPALISSYRRNQRLIFTIETTPNTRNRQV